MATPTEMTETAQAPAPPSGRELLLPLLAVFGAVLLWGGSFSVMKTIVADIGPIAVMWGRMAFAAAVLAALLPRLGLGRISKADLPALAVMALCLPCLYFLCESNALLYTTSAQAGVIASTVPVWVAAGAWMFLGERLPGRAWWGMALSIAGVAWLTLAGEPDAGAPNPLLGNLLEVAAMLCAAAYMIVCKRLSGHLGSVALTAVQVGVGLVFFLPGAFGLLPRLGGLGLMPWLALAYLGVGVTLGAFALYNYAISRMPASRASACINLVPVVAVVLGWLVLGEAMGPQQAAAAAAVLVGVWLSQR